MHVQYEKNDDERIYIYIYNRHLVRKNCPHFLRGVLSVNYLFPYKIPVRTVSSREQIFGFLSIQS